MAKITYAHLVDRYGKVAAHDLLLSIERLAKVNGENQADEESRLQRSLDSLTAMDFAS